MTLVRLSFICTLAAVVFLVLNVVYPQSFLRPTDSFFLAITCSVVLGSLGAFVFRKY